jgi:hypothetical protein
VTWGFLERQGPKRPLQLDAPAPQGLQKHAGDRRGGDAGPPSPPDPVQIAPEDLERLPALGQPPHRARLDLVDQPVQQLAFQAVLTIEAVGQIAHGAPAGPEAAAGLAGREHVARDLSEPTSVDRSEVASHGGSTASAGGKGAGGSGISGGRVT